MDKFQEIPAILFEHVKLGLSSHMSQRSQWYSRS